MPTVRCIETRGLLPTPIVIGRGLIVLVLSAASCTSAAQVAPTQVAPTQVASTQIAPTQASALRAVVQDAVVRGFAGNVLVVQNGRELVFESAGMANEELAVPHTRATRFKVHSTTKPFTATAVMLLVRDGKLQLDQPITELLPRLPASWSGITTRHLLQHTSGIPPEAEQAWLDAWDKVDTRDELDVLAVAAAKFPDRLASAPGEQWVYSNMGYVLASCVIARQAGVSFREFVRDRVLTPAGMTDSVFDDQAPLKHVMYFGNAVVPRLASGYNGELGKLETTSSRMYMERGAGGLITTADDLLRFASAFWRGALVGDAERAEMIKPWLPPSGAAHERGYGLGWITSERDGHRIVSHSGGNNGFVTGLSVWPDDNLVIVVLTNHGFFDVNALVTKLGQTALNQRS